MSKDVCGVGSLESNSEKLNRNNNRGYSEKLAKDKAMWNKRALQVKMVKTNDQNENIEECNHLDPDKINDIVKDQILHAAMVFVGVVFVTTVMHTVSEIAINATKPKEK